MGEVDVQVLSSLIPLVLITWFLFVVSRRPSKIVIDIDGQNLVVQITGRDAIYAMSRGWTLPLDCIRGITVVPAHQVPQQGLRWPGTGIPGALRAGSYGFGDRRDFWLVRKAPELLVIELWPGEPYRRIILEVPEVREEALRLRPSTGVYTGPLTA